MPKKTKLDLFAHLDAHPFVREIAVDKIYGCIIGSALGDTIGLYTEFLSKAQSKQIYRNRKFQLIEPATEQYFDSHRSRFAPCAWTDDTDQALLIVLSYLHNYTNTRSKTIRPTRVASANKKLTDEFAYRLKVWISQGLLPLNRHACGIGALVGSIAKNERFLEDPIRLATYKWEKGGRNAAPNGSLMRTHPIGIIGFGLTEEETWRLAVDVGSTTHADPRCKVACCIQVALIRGLLRGDIQDAIDVNAYIKRSYNFVVSLLVSEAPEDTKNPMPRLSITELNRHVHAKTLAALELDSPDKIGYVYKCLGSAIVLLRRAMHRNTLAPPISPLASETLFEDLTVDLIMEGGDADTNAAAACALLGAYLGYSRLPSHWTLGLAHKEWLMEKTYRLAIASGVIGDFLHPVDEEARDGGRGFLSREELRARDAQVLQERREEAFLKKRERAAVKKAERDEAIWNANLEKVKRAEAKERKDLEMLEEEKVEENTQDSEEDLSEEGSEEDAEEESE